MTRFTFIRSMTAATSLLSSALVATPILAETLDLSGSTLAGQVVTADQYGGTLSLVDLGTGKVETVAVPVAPHNVDATPDGRLLLLVGETMAAGMDMGNEDHGDEDGEEAHGLLVVLKADDPSADPVAEIPVGVHPAHVVTDLAGRRAFVTNAGDNTVSIVDLATYEVVGTLTTGVYPHGLRRDPQGRELYVANVEDGTVSVIDIARQTEVARIPVGTAPVQVGFLPDGSRAYVSLRDEDAVAVIDTATRKVVAKVPVGNGPIQVYATPDGRSVYVANEGFEDEPSNTVSVIDTATTSVVASIPAGDGPHGVSVSDKAVFVTDIRADSLSIIDPATQSMAATVPVGDGPNGVVYIPAASH